MAQYLIVHQDESLSQHEAKNIKEVASRHLLKEETAVVIYRLAGPGKLVSVRVEQTRVIDVNDRDPGE